MRGRVCRARILFAIALVASAVPVIAQSPPAPAPEGPPNILYGQVPPNGGKAPVIIFVHGLGSKAADWYVDNTMYTRAFTAGYRTAFVSFNTDLSNNSDRISVNAAKLRPMVWVIAAKYGVVKVYLVCHSKGGLDAQVAMLDPTTRGMVAAVFTLATPNKGARIAEWAFGPGLPIAQKLGLITPGLFDLQPANVATLRAQLDPVFESAGIPFYTVSGGSSAGNPLLMVTGKILTDLTGEANDGFVTISESRLSKPATYRGPSGYAMDLGTVGGAHHFEMAQGLAAFGFIHGRIQGLEHILRGFRKVATGGLGDRFNTWMWSQKWFKGKLYVGFGRAMECVTRATSDAQEGTQLYPPGDSECTPDPKDLPLRAEIWQLTPETMTWQRVYQAVADIPIGMNQQGNPVMAARDLGYRDMIVVDEPGGAQALYVAGVSTNALFGKLPEYAPNLYPPPQILRSLDGYHFAPIPQAPGTFLGDLIKNNTDINVVGYRSFQVYKGKLFASVTNLRGEGFIIESAEPWLGNNAWRRASPSNDELPVWDLQVFGNFLYVATGDRETEEGYGVYKTDATGEPPYVYTPIVTNGGYQPIQELRSPVALTLAVFNNMLYVGTNRKTEMIRIRPDDTWDLVAGEPRNTPAGRKHPISGIGQYFGSPFDGHFWQMKEAATGLHMGTWDWSIGLINTPFNGIVSANYGFDLFRTTNGVEWSAVSWAGMGDGENFGGRSMESTPFGFFLGTARPDGGAQCWLDNSVLDLNRDRVIDSLDVNLINAVQGAGATSPNDPRDIDRDGRITAADAAKLASQCTFPGCSGVPASFRAQLTAQQLAIPVLKAAPEPIVGRNVMLTWNETPGAARYRVYRIPVLTIPEILGNLSLGIESRVTLTIPGSKTIFTLPDDLSNGRVDSLCRPRNTPTCDFAKSLQDAAAPTVGFPLTIEEAAVVTAPSYQEAPPGAAQSLYFVRAEDSAGNLSDPSNFVGAPSKVEARNEPPWGDVEVAADASDGDSILLQSGTLRVSGWAVDPEIGAPVARVDVLIDNTIVGQATLNEPRPDVVAAFGRSDFLNSGWSFQMNIGTLPLGAHTVKALAHDMVGAAVTLRQHTFTVSN